MSVADAGLMPMVDRPLTKADHVPYTPADRVEYTEFVDGHAVTKYRVPYFELGSNGGVRRFVHQAFPMTVFQGYADAESQGKTRLRDTLAQNDRHLTELTGAGWFATPQAALDAYERARQDEARAAAEVAAAAQGMSEKAQRDYRRRSAASPDHVTE